MTHDTPLAQRMRELANHGHVRAEELNRLADSLDDAVGSNNFSAAAVCGAWARARRVYDECTEGVLAKPTPSI